MLPKLWCYIRISREVCVRGRHANEDQLSATKSCSAVSPHAHIIGQKLNRKLADSNRTSTQYLFLGLFPRPPEIRASSTFEVRTPTKLGTLNAVARTKPILQCVSPTNCESRNRQDSAGCPSHQDRDQLGLPERYSHRASYPSSDKDPLSYSGTWQGRNETLVGPALPENGW